MHFCSIQQSELNPFASLLYCISRKIFGIRIGSLYINLQNIRNEKNFQKAQKCINALLLYI